MAKNGGRTISTRAANALGGVVGVGGDLSKFAGAGGALVTLSSDLANGDKPVYSAFDAEVQFDAGLAGGELGAIACAETGSVDAGWAVSGFAFGFIGSSSAGIWYKYQFGSN